MLPELNRFLQTSFTNTSWLSFLYPRFMPDLQHREQEFPEGWGSTQNAFHGGGGENFSNKALNMNAVADSWDTGASLKC